MKKVSEKIIIGNVYKEPQIQKSQGKGGQGGWVFGCFAKKPFYNRLFEIKISNHKKGKHKETIAFNKKAKTFVMLIQGEMLIKFYNKNKKIFKKIILKKPGDFVFYNPGVAHDWIAIKSTRTLVARWPSIPKDQEELK